MDTEDIIKKLKLPLSNDYFDDYLFPDISIINKVPSNDYDNAIIHKKIINYGDTGTGKSSLARSLVEKLVNKYGVDNVNAVESNSIENAILYGLNNKPIQVHILEDFTLKDESRDTLRSYFRIRNIWKKEYNRSNGLIVSIFNLHRFYSSMVEVRSTANVLIIRSDSINPYDHSHLKKMIGDDGINDLRILEELRDNYPELKDYSPFRTRSKLVGLLKLPLSKVNYVNDVKDIIKSYSLIERMVKRNDILYGIGLIKGGCFR